MRYARKLRSPPILVVGTEYWVQLSNSNDHASDETHLLWYHYSTVVLWIFKYNRIIFRINDIVSPHCIFPSSEQYFFILWSNGCSCQVDQQQVYTDHTTIVINIITITWNAWRLPDGCAQQILHELLLDSETLPFKYGLDLDWHNHKEKLIKENATLHII